MHLNKIIRISDISNTEPINPNSSAITVKIKSDSLTGTPSRL